MLSKFLMATRSNIIGNLTCVYLFFLAFGHLLRIDVPHIYGPILGDFIFLFVFLVSLTNGDFVKRLIDSIKKYKIWISSIAVLFLVLCISLFINIDTRTPEFPILLVGLFRLPYFALLALHMYVALDNKGRLTRALTAYVAGLTFCICIFVAAAYSPFNLGPDGFGTVCSYPILDQRAISGSGIVMTIMFSGLLCLLAPRRSILFAAIASYCLLFTFSKSNWFIGAIALTFLMITLFKFHRRNFIIAALFGLLATGYLGNDVICLTKARLTVGSSTAERHDFIKQSFVFENLLIGKSTGGGLLEFYMTGEARKIVDKMARSTGYSSVNNPHNAFAYVFASGGIVSLVSFIVAAFYWLAKMSKYNYRFGRIIPIGFALCFVLYGSVQIQLFSYYYVWIWSGFIFSLLAITDEKTDQSKH